MSGIFRPLLPEGVGKTYVEIGGVKWATMNIGANSETDYGLYFQWGDTAGYTASQVGTGSCQKPFNFADCVLHNGTLSGDETTFTKYNDADWLTELEPMDDAAVANWGGNWRMPTVDEAMALYDSVNIAWSSDYGGSGVAGLVMTDKTDISKTLFFPAGGSAYVMHNTSKVWDLPDECYYWTSSIFNGGYYGVYTYSNGWALYMYNTSYSHTNFSRCYGCLIRPVLDE